LGQVGPQAKSAVPLLTEALRDESSEVRQAAAGALQKIRGQ
jgi:HEAT repeat protein